MHLERNMQLPCLHTSVMDTLYALFQSTDAMAIGKAQKMKAEFKISDRRYADHVPHREGCKQTIWVQTLSLGIGACALKH